MSSRGSRTRGTGSGAAARTAGVSNGSAGGGKAAGLSSLHTRQHSANTAGDVFAMLGSSTSGATSKDSRKKEETPTSSSKEGAQASKSVPEDPDSLSSPSSSSPSTPSSSLSSGKAYATGKQASKRFKALYTKPALLKLWKSSLKANIQLEDLYTSFEPPDQQQQSMEGSKYLNERGISGQYSKRNNLPTGEYAGALGRLPGSGNHGRDGPGARRTASGEHRYGIAGGVLSGTSSTGTGLESGDRRKPGYRDDIAGSGDFIQRDRPSAGRTRLNQRNGERELDQQQQQPQPRSAGLAWTSNRWRHLQTEEDSHSSSGNSSTNEEPESWQATPAATSEWRPTSKDRIRDERPKTKPVETALDDWDEGESKEDIRVPYRGADVHAQAAAPAVEAPRPGMTSSASNPALFLDDLLGPTRSLASSTQEVQPPAAVPASSVGSLSASTSRPSALAKPLSMLNIGGDPSLSASARGRQLSGNLTPTRAAAVEGLELLARRSPVQEVSMAHLQQQYLPQSQPTPPPSLRPEQIFWQYRDPSGQLQGPFSALQMQDWYTQGFFTETLLVKRTESADFETLGALIIRTGDPGKPFLSQPAPRLYGPPGIGLGQAPLAESPVAHRSISPAPWRGLPSVIGSQPSSRNASISSFNHDLFAPQAHIHSPQPTLPNQNQAYSMPHPEPAVSLDPWADMLPASPALQRGSSALGNDSIAIEQPIQAPLRRVLQSQQAPGPISPVAAPQRQPEAIPSPIGRAPLNAANDGFISAQDVQNTGGIPKDQQTSRTQQQLQASNPDPWATPAEPVKPAAQSVVEKPVSATAATEQAPTSTVTKKSWNALPPITKQASPEKIAPTASPVTDSAATSVATAKTKKAPSVTAVETAAPAPVKGKVSTATQEAFDKQKKADQAVSAPKHEPSLSSFSSLPDVASPSTATATKSAPWAKSTPTEEAAPKAALPASTSALSLREIQAKEEKEAEVRRAQEKRLQAAKTSAEEAAAAERLAKEMAESLPSSSKWGDVVSSPASTPSVAASTASPWAKSTVTSGKGAAKTASGIVKKTLKDIQEEEARRKKEAAQAAASAGQSGSGKGYASSISQARSAVSPSPAASSAGAAWTTVGTAKPATGTALPAKPVSTGAPAASMASRLAGTPASSSTVAKSTGPAAATKVATVNGRSATPLPSGKVDETITPASPDLLKWCREALKGLDIPVDDFIQMLLSFPVPLDKSVRELISDSVYSSSRTLDGRHFADAFADKRSADTKAIKSGKAQPAASGLGSLTPVVPIQKQPSMADALKFIPAPKAPETNFKIVTKSKGKKK